MWIALKALEHLREPSLLCKLLHIQNLPTAQTPRRTVNRYSVSSFGKDYAKPKPNTCFVYYSKEAKQEIGLSMQETYLLFAGNAPFGHGLSYSLLLIQKPHGYSHILYAYRSFITNLVKKQRLHSLTGIQTIS